ncbi:hypothetical protein [Micromonospora sp. WMMD812]|uniref:hypothetical protein n=1 Tax=Micromonospora sp. WMMD812 TaxID=3015152 RepID=UPI00248B9389|nr:hypothetical protein [Micromonospora sp. WMMD812]WBB69174.1 hypothetical protein O7603_07445 [Micromonospora sp. WMMD812]
MLFTQRKRHGLLLCAVEGGGASGWLMTGPTVELLGHRIGQGLSPARALIDKIDPAWGMADSRGQAPDSEASDDGPVGPERGLLSGRDVRQAVMAVGNMVEPIWPRAGAMIPTAKITAIHLSRLALVSVRQSISAQVRQNTESTQRQYPAGAIYNWLRHGQVPALVRGRALAHPGDPENQELLRQHSFRLTPKPPAAGVRLGERLPEGYICGAARPSSTPR